MAMPDLPTVGPSAWTDIQGLGNLQGLANKNSQAALPATAKQFEAVFIQMLIKSMRDASFGGGLFDSPQMQAWQGVFDQQIALSLANDGKGMGIATMLVHQLEQNHNSLEGNKPAVLRIPQEYTPRVAAKASRMAASVAATVPGPSADEPVPVQSQNSNPLVDSAEETEDSGGFINRTWDFVRRSGSGALQAATNAATAFVSEGPEAFVRRIAPYAEKAASELGVSVRAVLAQAALETGWGKHELRLPDGGSSHDLFGIKADSGWSGTQVSAPTVEYAGGAPTYVEASFRSYSGPSQSFTDYAQLLKSDPRYAAALGCGNDVAGFAHALGRAGYATDPNYAAKLIAIASSSTMSAALTSLKDSGTVPTTQ